MTFKAEIKGSIGWNWDHGVMDNGRFEYTRRLMVGHGPGQAEAVWHAEAQFLSGGQSSTLDLTALARSALGGTLATTLQSVRGMLVTNESTSLGKLIVGGAGGAAWSAPFGADGDSLELPPGGMLLLSAPLDGWPVNDGNRLLRLAAPDGPVHYAIALVGTTTASSPGSGSGSGSGN
jgi:hypothetical protein